MTSDPTSGSSSELPSGEELVEYLKESIQEVFSMMVIAFSESVVHKGEEGQDNVQLESIGSTPMAVEYEAIVDFDGACSGSVVLRCTAQGAKDIACGFLMLDDGDTLELEEICDALAECANLVTGTLKSKALDPVAEFSMSVPRSSGPNSPKTRVPAQDSGRLVYTLTEGLITAEVWLT